MLDVVCFCSGGAGWWGSWGSQFIADVRNKVLCTDIKVDSNMKPTGLFIAFASNFCTSSTDEPSFLRLYSQPIVSGCRLQSRPRNLHRAINLVDYYFCYDELYIVL
mgnify:CR=1 FL=1